MYFVKETTVKLGPRGRGVRRREKWPPHPLAKGLTRDNEPKKLEYLKGNNNNNKEERAESVVGLLCVSALSFHNGPGPGARESLGQQSGSFRKQTLLIQPRWLFSRIMLQWAPLEQEEAPGSHG